MSSPFHLPASVHYLAERHVWARPDDERLITVGVAAPLREVLWHAPEVEFWAVDRVEVGSTIATARARHGRLIAIASPVAGAMIELNELLDVAPHALVFQPYIRGWVARPSRQLGARFGRTAERSERRGPVPRAARAHPGAGASRRLRRRAPLDPMEVGVRPGC
jgi:glycine cleavage system H lipoate-binding protein